MKTTTGRPNFCGELQHPQRLAVALGPGIAEVPEDLLLGVAPFLVTEDGDRLPLVECGAGDDGVIVGEATVAVQLVERR